jgi:hypothetical protein
MFYWRHGSLLLYGDAVAHINIARRVFDSRTAGVLQLGTVWLPLPHLAMIPFLLSDAMWRSGIGGSIPSLIAYVLGTVGIFRLVRQGLNSAFGSTLNGRVAAWLAAAVYGANPNLCSSGPWCTLRSSPNFVPAPAPQSPAPPLLSRNRGFASPGQA